MNPTPIARALLACTLLLGGIAQAAAPQARTQAQRLPGQHGQLTIGAAHIAFPGLGRIRALNGAYEWLPLNYDGAPAAD